MENDGLSRVGRDFDYRASLNRKGKGGGIYFYTPPGADATRSVRRCVDVRARETIKVLEVSIPPRGVSRWQTEGSRQRA